MRILVVNVNTSAPMTEAIAAAARRCASPGLGLKTSKVSTYALPEPNQIVAWPLSAALRLQPGSGGNVSGDTR